MQKLLHVSFFIELFCKDGAKLPAPNYLYREECKEIFHSLGFQVTDKLRTVNENLIYFFYFKLNEVLQDLLSKGVIKSDNSQVSPHFALTEFYHENLKHDGGHQRVR